MTSTNSKIVTMPLAILAAVGTVALVANPVGASTLGDNLTYGNVMASSTCSNVYYDSDNSGASEPNYCKVVVRDGTKYYNTYVKKTALVKYCFNTTLTVDSVVSPGIDDMLANYYVAVIWGGAGKTGAINCH